MPPVPGFFGKLPVTGDFVARGLPDQFRRRWDAWVTRHLAPRLRAGGAWPAGGLRFRISSGDRVAAGVIMPGRDSVGRLFPLSLLVIGETLPGPAGLDGWCSAAAPLARKADAGGIGPDALVAALAALEPPLGDEMDGPAMILWVDNLEPLACDADIPGEALDRLLDPISSG